MSLWLRTRQQEITLCTDEELTCLIEDVGRTNYEHDVTDKFQRPHTKLLKVINIIRKTLLGLQHNTNHTHTDTDTVTGCKEVENRTLQLVEPCNFPHPHNSTLLHEFDLANTQMIEHTPTQCLPTPTCTLIM